MKLAAAAFAHRVLRAHARVRLVRPTPLRRLLRRLASNERRRYTSHSRPILFVIILRALQQRPQFDAKRLGILVQKRRQLSTHPSPASMHGLLLEQRLDHPDQHLVLHPQQRRHARRYPRFHRLDVNLARLDLFSQRHRKRQFDSTPRLDLRGRRRRRRVPSRSSSRATERLSIRTHPASPSDEVTHPSSGFPMTRGRDASSHRDAARD